MTPMPDDELPDELSSMARDYNAPGEVPREAMWARIAEARAVARIADRRARWLWPSVGIAAALVLSAGIAIGRRVERPGTAISSIALRPSSPTRTDSSAAPTVVAELRQETRNTDRRVHELAAAPAGSSDPLRTNLAYQLVVMRHLAGAEAMITSFRSTAAHGEQDAAMASWARELLGTTRTLEASPVARDAVMKRLLDDLDLVITQIVQYTTKGTYDPDELQLIEQSIDKRGVMSKLRSTLPDRRMATGL